MHLSVMELINTSTSGLTSTIEVSGLFGVLHPSGLASDTGGLLSRSDLNCDICCGVACVLQPTAE